MTTTAAKTSNDSKAGDGVGCLVVIIVAVVWYLGYTFWYAPSHREEVSAQPGAAGGRVADQRQEALGAVLIQVVLSIPDASPRLERLQGGNLDIYLTTREFQEVPYPDRSEFIGRVGKVWCAGLDRTFFPTVQFRDIKTGQVLGSYSCLLGKATLGN
jgi:hypothetical protein